MEKFLYYNELYLIYRELIKEKWGEIFDLYYGENLSMQEIADIKGISKSRVGIVVKSVEEKLDGYEKVLKLCEINNKLRELLDVDDLDKIKDKIKDLIKGE